MSKTAQMACSGQLTVSKKYGFSYYNCASKAADGLAEAAKRWGYDHQATSENKVDVKGTQEKK